MRVEVAEGKYIVIMEYSPQNVLIKVKYTLGGKTHRDGGLPATTIYDEFGTVRSVKYKCRGQYTRGVAFETFYSDGCSCVRRVNTKTKITRWRRGTSVSMPQDPPCWVASIAGNPYKVFKYKGVVRKVIYKENGQLHNASGPAIVLYANSAKIYMEIFYLEGQLIYKRKGDQYALFKTTEPCKSGDETPQL